MTLSFNSLRTAIIILDYQCRLTYLNHSAELLLGISFKQFEGQDLFDLIDIDFDKTMLLRLIEHQQNTYIEGVRFQAHSNSIISNIMLSHFEQDKKTYLQLELQSTEHYSHVLKDLELQQQNRVSNHLIRNLAHEIKNPLGGIKGAAQLLQRKLPDNFSDKYCHIIIQEADRLSELVSRLLLPAKPESKTLTNIHLLIEKALEIVVLQNNSDIQVIKDYDPSLPDLFIAAEQIQQSFLNLIKNAAEALRKNGKIIVKTRILHQHTIGNNQYKQVIKTEIIDNGCGVPESLMKDIFFPTISSKNSSGLGLSIAQSLVQRQNGIIEVESNSDQTIFSLYLPVEEHE